MRNKVDANSKVIVAALRAVGASVQQIRAATGEAGVPDLLVGWGGVNFLLEIKPLEGKREPRPRALDPKQVEWHAKWYGAAPHVVATQESALRAIGVIR